jgi:hypothetical protein
MRHALPRINKRQRSVCPALVNKPVGKPAENTRFERSRRRWEDGNEMDPKGTGLRTWTVFKWPRIVSSGDPL